MSKLQNQKEIARLPLSDWDIFPWSKEMYQRHEQEFQNILKEYREIKAINGGNAIMARNVWTERKGGIVIIDDTEIHATLKYQTISNTFDRFSEWLSFKEKREMTPEQMKAKIDEIKVGMKKADFSIPKEVMAGAERDVSTEEMKLDDITQHALNNF